MKKATLGWPFALGWRAGASAPVACLQAPSAALKVALGRITLASFSKSGR